MIELHPWAFPLISILGLTIISAMLTRPRIQRSQYDHPKREYRLNARSIGGLFVMLIYAFTFETLGFILSSILAMFLLSVVCSRTGFITALLSAAFLTSAIYMLMIYVLGVSLPPGAIL